MFKIQNTKYKIQKFKMGFSLVELLVVISIISILSGFLVTNYVGTRQRGRDAQRKSDLRQIAAALELFRSDKGNYACLSAGVNPPSGASCSGSAGRHYPTFLNSFTNYMGTITGNPLKDTRDPSENSSVACSNTNGRYLYYHNSTKTQYTLFAKLENSKDPDATKIKPTPYGPSGSACASGCATYTLGGGATDPCRGMVANFWINNP